MKDFFANYTPISVNLKNLPATLQEADTIIHEKNANIFIDDKLEIVIREFNCPYQFEWLKYHSQQRTSGLQTSAVVFGWQPEIKLKNLPTRHSCEAGFNKKQKNILLNLELLANDIEKIYENCLPEDYIKHQIISSKISSDFKICAGKSVFTGGIVNNSNALAYHADIANYTDTKSAMIYQEKGSVSGGELVLPEIKTAIKFYNNTLIIFAGAKYIHGVTPIKLGQNASRYTAVFYTNNNFEKYKTYKEAIESFSKYNLKRVLNYQKKDVL